MELFLSSFLDELEESWDAWKLVNWRKLAAIWILVNDFKQNGS